VKAIASRLARLERENRRQTAPQRLRIEYGYLATLPDDCSGPRHVVTLQQLPPETPGEDWFEWEERPGPEPASNTTGASGEGFDIGSIGVSYCQPGHRTLARRNLTDTKLVGQASIALCTLV